MARYAMVIDITRCNGCYNCFLACRDEYVNNDYPPYSASQPEEGSFWMRIVEQERGRYPAIIHVTYTPLLCQHCEEATCVNMAHNGEVYRRSDGIVIIDPEKTKGKEEIVSTCPYRVIYWNKEKGIPQKCTFCAHLLDAGWKEPRCVEACPTGALKFGDLDEPNSEVAKLMNSEKAEILHPEYGLKPRIRYIGLPKRFIAGSVVFDDIDECAENVEVILSAGRSEKRTTYTNNFGDFVFDNLPENKDYTVTIAHTGYKTKRMKVNTKADSYLGDIFLKKHRVI